MSSFLAVVFDLDDTLYPERDYVLSGFDAVDRWLCARHGLEPGTSRRELQGLFDLDPAGNAFGELASRRGLPASSVGEMIDVYRAHRPRISLSDGVKDVLGRLRKACLLGVVTDGDATRQRAKATALGVEEWVHEIVFTDDGGRQSWKPSPWGLELVAERLGVDPGRAIYVADNPAKDFLATRRAGMRSLRLRAPGGLHAATEPPSEAHRPESETSEIGLVPAALDAMTRGGLGRTAGQTLDRSTGATSTVK